MAAKRTILLAIGVSNGLASQSEVLLKLNLLADSVNLGDQSLLKVVIHTASCTVAKCLGCSFV